MSAYAKKRAYSKAIRANIWFCCSSACAKLMAEVANRANKSKENALLKGIFFAFKG